MDKQSEEIKKKKLIKEITKLDRFLAFLNEQSPKKGKNDKKN